ncbi:MAG: hypothetical protein ACI9LO_002063 [Planctomycetota bacterium]|jgi:hypothetical protein
MSKDNSPVDHSTGFFLSGVLCAAIAALKISEKRSFTLCKIRAISEIFALL